MYSNIMRPPQFTIAPLLDLFERLRACTMPELKRALGTSVDMTVFRKLAPLNYLSSYSHRGAFYSLPTIVEFDADGLWEARGARFATHGTLLNTVESFVNSSSAGFYATELEARLGVSVKDVLRQLAADGRIHRCEHRGLYLYVAKGRDSRQKQRAVRHSLIQEVDDEQQQTRAALVLFYGLLDEQQRRLFAGLESMKAGHGGDRMLADVVN